MSNIVSDTTTLYQEEAKIEDTEEPIYRVHPEDVQPTEAEEPVVEEPVKEDPKSAFPPDYRRFKIKDLKEVKECVVVRINFDNHPNEIMIFKRGLTEAKINRNFFRKLDEFDPKFKNSNAPLVRMASTDWNWELAKTIATIISNK